MADTSAVLLDKLLEERERLRGATGVPPDEAFELFTFEQILKEHDHSEDEITAGQVGGGNDGGIDGLYCFLNGNLLEEDAEVLDEGFDPSKVRREPELALIVIQAKRSASFGEAPFEKLASTLGDLLELSKDDEGLAVLYSRSLLDRASIFRRAWYRLATRHPKIHVRVCYASKGEVASIHPKVRTRASALEQTIMGIISKPSVDVEFLGSRELVDFAGREKSYTLQLTFQENATASESHIALVSLEDYYAFISEDGTLRKHIFDWNVRDYEGDVEVNKEIADTLAEPIAPEFWWLNNGVTVICSRASSTGKTFSLDDVQIVNGLQTSVTIYQYLASAREDDSARKRSLLVRIIVTDDHRTRDKVIRATNRQTAVSAAALRATDQIQRDLEAYFLHADWFYERRKNYFRNQGKTPAKTVTIPYLAQAIMAIGLSEPSNSRARPSSLLKNNADYRRLFDSSVDPAVYLWIAQVQKAVDAFLRTERAETSAPDRTNLKFYVSMLLVARRHGSPLYNPKQLRHLCGTEFSDDEVLDALAYVRSELGAFQARDGAGVDRIVKNRLFTEALLRRAFPAARRPVPVA